MTRMAAAGIIGINYNTIAVWINRYPKFAEAVAAAEQEAEARFTQVIARAAFGIDVTRTRTVQKIVAGVPVTETTTETFREHDWKAAQYWLSRRRRSEWGENVTIDLDNEIKALLAQLAQLPADPIEIEGREVEVTALPAPQEVEDEQVELGGDSTPGELGVVAGEGEAPGNQPVAGGSDPPGTGSAAGEPGSLEA